MKIDIQETTVLQGEMDGETFSIGVFAAGKSLEKLGTPDESLVYYEKAAEVLKQQGMPSCSAQQAHAVCLHVWKAQAHANEELKKSVETLAESLTGMDSMPVDGQQTSNVHGSATSTPATPSENSDSASPRPHRIESATL